MANTAVKVEMLQKSLWDAKDIATYFGVGSTTAYKIKKKAERSKFSANYVTSDSVLKVMGAEDREKELECMLKTLQIEAQIKNLKGNNYEN